ACNQSAQPARCPTSPSLDSPSPSIGRGVGGEGRAPVLEFPAIRDAAAFCRLLPAAAPDGLGARPSIPRPGVPAALVRPARDDCARRRVLFVASDGALEGDARHVGPGGCGGGVIGGGAPPRGGAVNPVPSWAAGDRRRLLIGGIAGAVLLLLLGGGVGVYALTRPKSEATPTAQRLAAGTPTAASNATVSGGASPVAASGSPRASASAAA